jgi:glycosyltransferase involved in cell wall biosynthesis
VKVAIISTYKVKCGISTYTNYLARELKAQGHEVMIFAEVEHGNGVTGSDIDLFDIPYIRCWSRDLPYVSMSQKIMKWKPDVVHIQHESALFRDSNSLIILIRHLRRNGIPVVITFHNVSKDKLIPKIVGSVSCAIVHNQRMMAALTAHRLPNNSLVTIVSHGSYKVNLTDKQEARRHFGIPEDKFVFSVFGFVGREKGHYLLLSVFPKVRASIPNAYLLFAGGAHPILPENVANHMRVIGRTITHNPDCMKITGYLTEREIDLAISASDMIIFPHFVMEVDSVSGVLHRVLSGGRPIVVTDFPLYDDVQSGVQCVRLPVSINLFSIPTILSRLAQSSRYMEMIADKARKLADETSWDKIAEITAVIYGKVVELG